MNTQHGNVVEETKLENLVLNLEDSLYLLKLGWKHSTTLSWYQGKKPFVGISGVHSESKQVPAPSASEILDALPPEYMGFNLALTKWESAKQDGLSGYDAGYWNPKNSSYEFLSSSQQTGSARLVDTLGGMWVWLHGDEPSVQGEVSGKTPPL